MNALDQYQDAYVRSYALEDRLKNYDLVVAMREHGYIDQAEKIESVYLEIKGCNDGPNWHWICQMMDGSWMYVEGGCDYTGWDCQSHCYIYPARFLDDCMALVPQDERLTLIDMISKGESVREAIGW